MVKLALVGVWTFSQQRTKSVLLRSRIKLCNRINMIRFVKERWIGRGALVGDFHMAVSEFDLARLGHRICVSGLRGSLLDHTKCESWPCSSLLWMRKAHDRKPTRSASTWVNQRRQKTRQLGDEVSTHLEEGKRVSGTLPTTIQSKPLLQI